MPLAGAGALHRHAKNVRERRGVDTDGGGFRHGYKGRGFIQLTGRDNYRTIGRRIGVPLEREPDLANDSELAARILAAFLKAKEIRIKQALVDGDLARARRLVNGGRHGLDRFRECYDTGARLLV